MCSKADMESQKWVQLKKLKWREEVNNRDTEGQVL